MHRCARISMSALAVAALALAPSADANLLTNPSFEEPNPGQFPNGWGGFANAFASSGFGSGSALSGSQAIVILGGFSGAPSFSGVSQNVPVTAGTEYEASLNLLVESLNDQGNSDNVNGTDNRIELILEWRDSGGNQISSDGAVMFDGTLGPVTEDVWANTTFTATAPAGAVEVTFLGLFIQPSFQGGVAFLDDASLTVVPEPASAALLGLGGLAALRRRRA